MPITLDDCRAKDRVDPLSKHRDRFGLPAGVIYLDGNSLGALPKATSARLNDVVQKQWGTHLIKSWNIHDWIGAPQRVGAKIADLIGAGPHEVIVGDSTSLNVFKALSAALALRPDRRVVLSDKENFPTDLYMAQGLIELMGKGHELRLISRDEIEEHLTRDVAVLMLTEVDYRTGALYDMARVTGVAHSVGALTIWDLAHSAGAFPVELNRAKADFAIGCGYKYLNGGPGAPAFIYVAERWLDQARQPLFGWMGHAAPFAFDSGYEAGKGIAKFLVGTPPILSLTALEAGLDEFQDVDLKAIQAKSRALGDLFIALVEQQVAGFGFELASPRDAASRGSQVSFRHQHGYPIMQALIARGVIGDFRAPDIVRFGLTPLYTSHSDIWHAVQILKSIMVSEEWRKPEFSRRAAVT